MSQKDVPNCWQVFSAAPHRMMLFGGVVQLVLSLILWGWELAGRYMDMVAGPVMVLPGVWVHGFLMLYTVFPFFIFGFLMTTYPRWMNGDEVPRNFYVRSFVLMFIGVLVFYVGIFFGSYWMVAGILLLLFGWGVGVYSLLQVYRLATSNDKRYELLLNGNILLAAVGMLSFLIGVMLNIPGAVVFSMEIGLWGFLLPLLITVSFRMLPFFSECVLKPYQRYQPFWMLGVMVVSCYIRLLLLVLDMPHGLLLSDLPLAFFAVYLGVRWGWLRSFQVRLLAMLYIAFSWLCIGMWMHVFQDISQFYSAIPDLGRAPMHALAIGYVTLMAMAMTTRVSLGHSGRTLQVDGYTWWLFLGINLVAGLRVLGEMPGLQHSGGLHANLLAASVWLLCFSPWVWRMGMIYWTPRVDGRSG